jgi:hypothetical protein
MNAQPRSDRIQSLGSGNGAAWATTVRGMPVARASHAKRRSHSADTPAFTAYMRALATHFAWGSIDDQR